MKEIISQYQPLWFSIAKKYSGDVHTSEELVQDALVRYLQSENAEVKNIKAYVAKTIYHLYINQIRKEKIRNEYSKQQVRNASTLAEQDSRLENGNEVKHQLSKMYKMLTPGERAVFVLRKAFDYDFEQICELFRITNENCRQLMCRAKGKMQEPGKPYFRPGKNEAAFINAFFKASRNGHMEELITILRQDLGKKYLKVSRASTMKEAKGMIIEMGNNRMEGLRA